MQHNALWSVESRKWMRMGLTFLAAHCFCRIPTVGGKALDLHQLFVEVTSRGGLEKVCSSSFF